MCQAQYIRSHRGNSVIRLNRLRTTVMLICLRWLSGRKLNTESSVSGTYHSYNLAVFEHHVPLRTSL